MQQLAIPLRSLSLLLATAAGSYFVNKAPQDNHILTAQQADKVSN